MDVKIKVGGNLSFPWHTDGKGRYVCGVAFEQDRMLRGEDFLRFFEAVDSLDTFINLVNRLDGFFSIIVKAGEETYAAVDQIRSLQLFWIAHQDGSFTLCDYLGEEEASACGIDRGMLPQAKHSYFVSGNDTLLQGTRQLTMGEVLALQGGQARVISRWQYDYAHVENDDEAWMVEGLKPVYDKIFRQLVAFLDGRQAIIPLSGGHDSRLIAYYLKKVLRYDNIVAITYGYPGNGESAVSEQVAKYLGIPWHFVEYVPADCRKFYREERAAFLPYLTSAVSLPVLQDFYALHRLIGAGKIAKDGVVIPGHLADVTAGSHLPKRGDSPEALRRSALFEQIFHWHYRQVYCPPRQKVKMMQIISRNKHCRDLPEQLSPDAYDLSYERYFIGERTSKYICNSSRAYEYLSLQWYLPGATKTLSEAWKLIPNNYRKDRYLYQLFEKSIYEPGFQAIPFFKEAKTTRDPKGLLTKFRFVWSLYFPGSFMFAYISTLRKLKTYFIDLSVQAGTAFGRDAIKLLKKAARSAAGEAQDAKEKEGGNV